MASIDRKTTVERAIERTRGGKCRTPTDIKCVLKAEDYCNMEVNLFASALRKKLVAFIRRADRHFS